AVSLVLFKPPQRGDRGIGNVFIRPRIRPLDLSTLGEIGKLTRPSQNLPGFFRRKRPDDSYEGLLLDAQYHISCYKLAGAAFRGTCGSYGRGSSWKSGSAINSDLPPAARLHKQVQVAYIRGGDHNFVTVVTQLVRLRGQNHVAVQSRV